MNNVAEAINARYSLEMEAAGRADSNYSHTKPHSYVLNALRDVAHIIALKNPDDKEQLYAAVRMMPPK